MKHFNVLRNLMLSLLVMGVAGSIIGAGTFATFNATTTSTNNTFSTGSVTFSNTDNGGTCTSTTGGTASPAGACTAGTSYTGQLSNMVPGDSKIMFTTLANGGNVKVTVNLGITDAAVSHDNIVTTGIGSAGTTATGTQGLGLIVFECRNSSHQDIACNDASVAELYVVYGSCGTLNGSSHNDATFATVTQAGPFTSSNVNTTSITDNSIAVGTTPKYCYGGNTAAGLHGLSVPIVASSGNPTVNNSNSLNTSSNDSLAMIVYLPYIADNTVQAKTNPNLTLTWTATQIAGASS